jgi:hypothetical protein
MERKKRVRGSCMSEEKKINKKKKVNKKDNTGLKM